MYDYDSELTFSELTNRLSFVKVIWNNKVIYNDEGEEGEGETPQSLKDLYRKYGNRYVYNMNISIKYGHHCELNIIGDKQFTKRERVYGLFLSKYGNAQVINTAGKDLYEFQLVEPKDIKFLKKVKNKRTTQDLIDYLDRFEYTYGRNFTLYEIELNNPMRGKYCPKYGWLSNCTKFYVFKEE